MDAHYAGATDTRAVRMEIARRTSDINEKLDTSRQGLLSGLLRLIGRRSDHVAFNEGRRDALSAAFIYLAEHDPLDPAVAAGVMHERAQQCRERRRDDAYVDGLIEAYECVAILCENDGQPE